MKFKIFIFSLFLLHISLIEVTAQRRVTVKVESIFSFSPLGDWYSKNSLSPVATYIKAWREDEPKTELYVLDSLDWGYRHYLECVDGTLLNRVLEYLGAEQISEIDSTIRVSDLSDFASSKSFEEHFNQDIWAIKRYFATPIAKFDSTIKYNAYGDSNFQSLFHTFQCEVAGTEISLFAPPKLDAQLQNELYIKDIASLLYFENNLVVVELTGKELKGLLEDTFAKRYYQIKNIQSDMLRFRTPAYLHVGIGGVEFTLNLTKPKGRKIENWSLDDNTIYRVALNSFLARNLKITQNLGNYKSLLIDWIRRTDNHFKAHEKMHIEPQRIVKAIKLREYETIFGKSIF